VSDTLGLGLIGAGKHGGRYAQHIAQDIPGVALRAICRRNRDEGETLAARHGAAYHADYHEVLARADVDAVVVAVPPTLHPAIAEAACAAGKHLLLEKPLAASLAEARHIRDLVTASRVRCMVAQTLRFNAVVQALRAAVESIAPLQFMYLSQRFEPSSLAWLDRKAESGGGIVLHTGVHSFDLLRFLSGREVDEVSCQTARVVTVETEDNFVASCRMRDPVLRAVVTNSRSTRSRNGLIELSGEGGQLVGDHAHGVAFAITGLERRPLPIGPMVPTVREAVRAFASALGAGTEFPVTLDDGLRAVAVVDACYRSAASGTPARVME
jgi:predicted dehydrogenase